MFQSILTAAPMGGDGAALPRHHDASLADMLIHRRAGLVLPGSAQPRIAAPLPGPRQGHEACRWNVLAVRRHWRNQDIDWYRAKYGKVMGEFRFFAENPEPDSLDMIPGNMVMASGVAALWAYAMGLGTTAANTALQGATYFSNANTYIGVGDGGITTGTGTLSVAAGTNAVTFSTSQSGLQGKYITVTGDSSNGLYIVASGSGTAWTLATNYGGTTSASGAAWSYLTAESHAQTGLQGTTNTYLQAADSGFPTNPYAAQLNAITAATNASPIVLTIAGGDINTNDIVQVFESEGNTAANGIFVANPASATSVTLLNSTGNGAWTYGGIVTKRTVLTCQATFGSTSGNWSTGWWEFSLFNGNLTNKIALNRRVTNLGVKSGGTTALKIGIGIG